MTRVRTLVAATALTAGLGLAALVLPLVQQRDSEPPAPGSVVPDSASVAGGATLEVLADQETDIRVSIDGAEAYAGVLQPGDARRFAGDLAVRVWAKDARTLRVAVNGHDLGYLSSAVGHPEWTTIDWSWPAGWKP